MNGWLNGARRGGPKSWAARGRTAASTVAPTNRSPPALRQSAVWALAADSGDEARRLAASSKMTFRLLRQ